MKKKAPATPDELLQRLAASTPNDAVKLLFLDGEELSLLDGLDLCLLTEMKRSANGTMEIKLVDRLDIIRELRELQSAERSAEAPGAGFYAALDKAASRLSDTGGGNEV